MIDSIDNGIKSAGSSRLSRRSLVRGAAAAGIALPFVNRSLKAAPLPPKGSFLSRYQDATPAAIQLPDFSGKTLNFLIIQPHAVTGELLKADFEAATGAKVNVTVVPYDQVQAKATLDVQSGANELDVIDYWYTTVGALASQGILEDLTDFIANDPDIDPADFIPSIYDTYTLYDGKRWGLPYDGDTHVLFYNTEIFARHNLTAPQSWEDYLTNAKTVTEAEGKDGIYGAGIMGAKFPIILGCSYVNRLAGYGGSLLSADGKPTLDTPEAIAAAQALVDAAPYALPTPLETAFEQALPAFSGGKTAHQEFWTDLGVYAQSSEGTLVADKWDVVQNPYGGSNTNHVAPLNAGFAFGVSTGAKEKEVARWFVKFATSKAFHVKTLTTVGSGIDPMRVSGLNSEAYKAFAPKVQVAAGAALNSVLAWPTIPQSPDLMTKLTDEIALVLQGSKSPEDALKAAQESWVQILG
ncbi:MAG: multiple sugar transport system substrate-binding protein [Thermomicrobiales bacterium]|jgi:multiple sugar transport system substrate-binding protein|nr:multiple sugar transport system substrate-binding protein [Thermomicrobiales bacterium]